MTLEVVLCALYVGVVLGAMAIVFGMKRLQGEIDSALAHNAKLLREIGETWARCAELNDKTMRALRVIEKKNKEGEGWKRE